MLRMSACASCVFTGGLLAELGFGGGGVAVDAAALVDSGAV